MPLEEELDLHGMSVEEALSAFRSAYARSVAWGCRSLRVIHGYGASGEGGTIKKRIRGLLERYPDLVRYTPGESYGNPGESVVYPLQALPDVEGDLRGEILRYCLSPKSQGKIVGRFRRYKDPEIRRLLQELQGEGLLKIVFKSGIRHYQSR